MKRLSVSDVATATGVGREDARGLVRFLAAKGFARDVGARPIDARVGGRGERVYEIPDDLPLLLASEIRVLFADAD